MSNNAPTDNTPDENKDKKEQKPKCGIIMPISEIDGVSEKHWAEVLTILSAAIEDAGFEADLVSNTDEVGIIQQTIIQNLYDNPIVVCDVSAKNPNVMFELGMRLAFDKPTVIVKDDKTSYSFDTSVIQHLGYPRDLHYHQIVEFKTKLAKKVRTTHRSAENDPEYTTFLKHFGEFKVAKLDQKEVPAQEFIIDQLKHISASVNRLELATRTPTLSLKRPRVGDQGFLILIRPDLSARAFEKLSSYLAGYLPDAKISRDHGAASIILPLGTTKSQYVELTNFLDANVRDWQLKLREPSKSEHDETELTTN